MDPDFVVFDSVAAVLRVSGEDAYAYLQSQFSGDLRPARDGAACVYGLWLTRKGRVAADSFVMRDGATWWVVSYHADAESLRDKVCENIIADDVEVEVVSPVSMTVSGPGVASALVAGALPVPAEGVGAAAGDALVFFGRRGVSAYEVIFTRDGDRAAGAKRLMRERMSVVSVETLESLRVSAGLPRVPADCGPGDLPQDAGLDVEAVCFDKGCYLGQEVMARLKAQGRPTRFLARVVLPSAVFPLPAKLYAGADEAGEIRSEAAWDGRCVAMAMLRDRVSAGVESFSLEPCGPAVVLRYPIV